MRQLNKLKVAITAGIILLIIIAIVALVLKLNNSTYFSKETSIDTVINNIFICLLQNSIKHKV